MTSCLIFFCLLCDKALQERLGGVSSARQASADGVRRICPTLLRE